MSLSFGCAIMNGENEMIFPIKEYDMIYRFNTVNGECRCLEGYVPEGGFTGAKYGSICKCQDRYLILAPSFSNRVYIHDMYENEGRYITLRDCKVNSELFMDSCVYGDCVYLLPRGYDAIVKIDLLTNQVVYYDEMIKEMKDKVKHKMYFWRGSVTAGDYLYAPFYRTNVILKMNLKDDTYCLVKSDDETDQFVCMCSVSDNIYVMSSDGKISVFDLERGVFNTGFTPDDSVRTSDVAYASLCTCKDFIAEFSCCNSKINILSTSGREINYVNSINNRESQWFSPVASSEYVYAFAHGEKVLYKIDIEKAQVIEKIKVSGDKNENIDFKSKYFDNQNDTYFERDGASVNKFIDFLVK